VFHAGLLCKVPHQEGNEERQGHHHEEWPPRHPGRLSVLRHQDVQDRKVTLFTRQDERGFGFIEAPFLFLGGWSHWSGWFDNLKQAVYIGIVQRAGATTEKDTVG
jgi:hypothetical protein